ncbi:MAG: hypothetical protein WBQ34_09575 [Candidatus Acidiferrales bacterium]
MVPSRTSGRNRPVFIQAMWRTASTYVWRKFRAQPGYRCYYEPLHEMLVKPRERVLSVGDERRTSSLRHPAIDRPYFAEFPFACEGGAKFFQKPLSYERYCLREGDKDNALHRYISNLIAHASRHKQRAVLQFNRGLLRAGWLTRKFSPVNILVLRKPANVWKSFLSFSDGSFTGALCIVLGQNKAKWPLNVLPDWLDLPCRMGATVEDDYVAYSSISGELASRMYPSFFDFYLAAILHSARYADCILDVDEISVNPSARAAAQRRLREFGIEVDFSDCSVPSYALETAQEREWLAYEDFARRFLRALLPVDLLLPRRAFNSHRSMLGSYFRELLGEVVSEARSRLTIFPQCAAAKHAEGLQLFQTSRKEESATAFGDALASEQTSERWNDWSTAQAACSRLVVAELGYRQALKLDRWNSEAAGNLGALLASLGRNSEALPLLEQAERAADHGATCEIGRLLAGVRESIREAGLAKSRRT